MVFRAGANSCRGQIWPAGRVEIAAAALFAFDSDDVAAIRAAIGAQFRKRADPRRGDHEFERSVIAIATERDGGTLRGGGARHGP